MLLEAVERRASLVFLLWKLYDDRVDAAHVDGREDLSGLFRFVHEIMRLEFKPPFLPLASKHAPFLLFQPAHHLMLLHKCGEVWIQH